MSSLVLASGNRTKFILTVLAIPIAVVVGVSLFFRFTASIPIRIRGSLITIDPLLEVWTSLTIMIVIIRHVVWFMMTIVTTRMVSRVLVTSLVIPETVMPVFIHDTLTAFP